MGELLEKIPAEKRWEITAKTLIRIYVSRGTKTMPLILSKEEGVFSPVMGVEKWTEILMKMYSDGAKKMFPRVKERFNIKIEDAIGAENLISIVSALQNGPLYEWEDVEKTPERVVSRMIKCPYWESYEEFEIDHALRTCDAVHQLWGEEGFKSINCKVTYKLTKALPREDPYCEEVYEFKEE